MNGERIAGWVIVLGAILVFWFLEGFKFFHIGANLNVGTGSAPKTSRSAGNVLSWPCVTPSSVPSTAVPAAAGQAFALGAPVVTTQAQSSVVGNPNSLPKYARAPYSVNKRSQVPGGTA